LSEIRPKNVQRFGKKLPRFWKNLPRFSRNVGRFFALARRDEKEAALLVFHTKGARKQSSESTNLKMAFSRAHAYAHNSNFRVFAFTTFTEILATLSVSIHSTHLSDIF
jgi:hypothetical protein